MEDIAALVVLYHPDYPTLRALLERLIPQVAKIYIANNGPQDESYQPFKKSVESARIEFLEMGGNAGVACALNQGLRAALDAGHTFCWTFDQDSLPGPGDATILLDTFHRNATSLRKVAAAVPAVYNLHRTGKMPFLVEDADKAVREKQVEHEQEVSAAITSGMLVDTAVWHATGGAREDYFIDHVDTEWCFRARAQGYRIFCNPSAQLRHRLGASQRSGFASRISAQRPAMRTYYMVRNALKLVGEPYVPANWLIYSGPKMLRTCLLALALGPERIEQGRAIARAFIDARSAQAKNR